MTEIHMFCLLLVYMLPPHFLCKPSVLDTEKSATDIPACVSTIRLEREGNGSL